MDLVGHPGYLKVDPSPEDGQQRRLMLVDKPCRPGSLPISDAICTWFAAWFYPLSLRYVSRSRVGDIDYTWCYKISSRQTRSPRTANSNINLHPSSRLLAIASLI